MKQMNLELGGKSPHVVFSDASSLETAAEAVARGLVRMTGQLCQAGSRLLIQCGVKDEFMPLLLEKIAQAKMGDPLDPGTVYGPLISREQLERVERLVELGSREATLIHGGRRPTGTEFSRGFFFEPTVFDDVPPSSRIAQEEIFGPVLAVIPFEDLADAIRIANDSEFGLVSGCWTQNIDTALRFARGVRTGVVWVNSYRDDAPLKHLPMGAGYKSSGAGREWGVEGLEAFMETKSIMIRVGESE